MRTARFNFIARHADALLEIIGQHADSEAALQAVYPQLKMGRERWLVPAFLRLRERGMPVALSSRFDAAAINVLHNDDLANCSEPWRHFLVTVRADRDPAFISHVDICQNNSSVWSDRHLFIPYWPQPGLVPRDPGRGNCIRTVAYLGKIDNLAPAFRGPAFRQSLLQQGVTFRIEEQKWQDYSDVDLVLSVRVGAREYLCSKPASKLVNAWAAGCPAILNAEHGYLELRRSEADFLIANTPEEAVSHIVRLINDPREYSSMVQNGLGRARHFSWQSITSIWQSQLEGPVRAAFHDWGRWSDGRRRAWYLAGRLRQRAWGWQVLQAAPGELKSALRFVRRALALPRAASLPVRSYPDPAGAPP